MSTEFTARERAVEARIVQAFSRMPYLPAATHKRTTVRDFDLETVAEILEDLADYLIGVGERQTQLEQQYRDLESDVQAVRRIFGL